MMRLVNPRCAVKLENSVVIDNRRVFPCSLLPKHQGEHRWIDPKNSDNFIAWEVKSNGHVTFSMRSRR